MPMVTIFNLRREDRLSDLEEATRRSLTSMPELELATRLAKAFRAVAGEDRRVKVVIRPYDVERSGWVSP
jgi:hypothetical protein